MEYRRKRNSGPDFIQRLQLVLLAGCLLAVALLWLAGCTQTDVEDGTGTSGRGEAEACFYLNVLSNEMPLTRSLTMTREGTVETDSLPQTRSVNPMPDQNEKKINSLWVGQFDASGKRIYSQYFGSMPDGEFINLKLKVTDTDCRVYFVTNTGSLDSGSATEAEFRSLSFAHALTNEGLPETGFCIMEGEWTGIVSKGSNLTDQISLVRLLAKISLTYAIGGTDFTFTPEAVRLCNVPSHSRYVVPDGQIDETGYSTYAVTQPEADEHGSRTVYWYLPENRAGQATGADAVASEKQKTGQGVSHATYIEITGTATQRDVTYENVAIRLYPGEDANDYTVGRNCYYQMNITLTGIDVTDERVVVNQVPGIDVPAENIPAHRGGEKADIQVTARPGVEWYLDMPNWLSVLIDGTTTALPNVRATHKGPAVVKFTAVAANPYAEERSVDFPIGDQTMRITQDGSILEAAVESPMAAAIGSVGSHTFRLTEGLAWKATIMSDWLEWNPGCGSAADSLHSKATAIRLDVRALSSNPTDTARIGRVDLKGGYAVKNDDYASLRQTLMITQAGSTVVGQPVTVPAEPATNLKGKFTATKELPWDASILTGSNWFTLSDMLGGSNTTGSEQEIAFYTTAVNTSSAIRTGTIQVHAGNALTDEEPGPTGTIIVNQQGAKLEVSNGVTIPAAASSNNTSRFKATKGLSWNVSKNVDWLTLAAPVAGTDNTTGADQNIVYSVTPHPTPRGANRTGTITIKVGNAVGGSDAGLTMTISVSQSAFETHFAAYGMPLPATAGASYPTGTYFLHFVGSVGLPYSVTVPAGSWLSLSGDVSGTTNGDNRTYFHAGVNPGGVRSATITLKIGNSSWDVGISQSASTFGLATTSIAAPAAGGDYWIGVNATPGLGYSISNQSNQGIASVITLNPSSGFTIRVNQNTGAARSATITATSTGGGHSGTVTVSQAAGETPAVVGNLQVCKTNAGPANWNACYSYCNTLTAEGYTGWRLPTKGEFRTIFANKSSLESVSGFAAFAQMYWCSDAATVLQNGHAIIDMKWNGGTSEAEDTSPLNVRCVRNR